MSRISCRVRPRAAGQSRQAARQGRREEIPGFAWLRAKNKPPTKFALTREKQKKTPPQNTQKKPKQNQNNFFSRLRQLLTRETKKPPQKLSRLRAKNSRLPGVGEISQKKHRNFLSAGPPPARQGPARHKNKKETGMAKLQ